MTRELIKDDIEHCTIPDKASTFMSRETIRNKFSFYWECFLELFRGYQGDFLGPFLPCDVGTKAEPSLNGDAIKSAKEHTLKCCSHWRAR